jgi:hypothetical protein
MCAFMIYHKLELQGQIQHYIKLVDKTIFQQGGKTHFHPQQSKKKDKHVHFKSGIQYQKGKNMLLLFMEMQLVTSIPSSESKGTLWTATFTCLKKEMHVS